jgi:bacteriorhodopsin
MPCGGMPSELSPEMMMLENYNGNNVCDNQDDFNIAFQKAVKQDAKDRMKNNKPWIFAYTSLWLVFFVWALLLAMRVQPGPSKVVHLVFALVFSPIYVISYYFGMLSEKRFP